MSHIIHARLDEAAEKIRRQLATRLGWSDSQIVREGIRSLAGRFAPKRPRKIAGLGRFASGIDDLGSNKKHLTGLGR